MMYTGSQSAAPKSGRRVTTRVLGAAALIALVAACGSSSKSTSSGGTAATTTASGSAASSGLAQAESFVAKYSQQPSAITDTAKIQGTIAKGKTIYFVPCGPNAECQQEGAIVKQATDMIGWTTVVVPNDGTPQGDKSAFDTVVRARPAAVLYTAIPQSVFQSEIPQLQANGTAVIACCVTDATGNGVDYNIDNPTQSAMVGTAQGDWVASDSKCTNADSVIVNIPDFAILSEGVKSYKSALSAACPSANTQELDIALADLSNASSTIVSFVRSHSSVKYVAASTDGIVIGLPAALKAAGLTPKIVGQGATPTNIQYLHSGDEAADVAFPYNEVMWAMVTAAVQKATDNTITPSVAPPLWILTPSNAPTTTSTAFPVVNDFQAQYKTLWGVTS